MKKKINSEATKVSVREPNLQFLTYISLFYHIVSGQNAEQSRE